MAKGPQRRRYDACVFIGRFQPFHLGHSAVIQTALDHAEQAIILIGGANGARRPRNPWTFQERAQMIQAEFPGGRIRIMPLADATYNDDMWIERVQGQVASCVNHKANVALIGHHKDASGYYLKMFPQWENIGVPGKQTLFGGFIMDATTIRDRLFLTGELPTTNEVSPPVLAWLTEYMGTPYAREMREQYRFAAEYRKTHDSGKYHRNNVCSDAVVLAGGHILLVQRRQNPGKGLLALPGGHIERKETALDACIRELKEETGIKVPEPALRGSLVSYRVFDDPYRSDLCRTYSHTFLFRLKNERRLPALKISAETIPEWRPLVDVHEDQLFDDHYHIITAMTGAAV